MAMFRRNDPRFRRTLNELSQTLESANETAQTGLFTFTQTFIHPCASFFSQCLEGCAVSCFPSRDEHGHHRRRTRGRAELSFDFYDDWEDDEHDGLLGWGNDELDRLLGGASGSSSGGRHYGAVAHEPGRQRVLSYEAAAAAKAARARRKSTAQHEAATDPTIIPSSSYFGFLGRLPWRVGGRGLRYRPSAADLRERPGAIFARHEVGIEEIDGEEEGFRTRKRHRRNRSGTAGSENTTDSMSSRGDIFPSEDEDDAVPLDDEFAVVLERRNTGHTTDDSSGKANSRGPKRSSNSRVSIRTESSRGTHEEARIIRSDMSSVPTLSDLKDEEDILRVEEEEDVERKRSAAHKLAEERGLNAEDAVLPVEDKPESPSVASIASANQHQANEGNESPPNDDPQSTDPT